MKRSAFSGFELQGLLFPENLSSVIVADRNFQSAGTILSGRLPDREREFRAALFPQIVFPGCCRFQNESAVQQGSGKQMVVCILFRGNKFQFSGKTPFFLSRRQSGMFRIFAAPVDRTVFQKPEILIFSVELFHIVSADFKRHTVFQRALPVTCLPDLRFYGSVQENNILHAPAGFDAVGADVVRELHSPSGQRTDGGYGNLFRVSFFCFVV